VLIRNAVDGGLDDRRMLLEHRLDLARCDVLAT